jgi:hypothetical protein
MSQRDDSMKLKRAMVDATRHFRSRLIPREVVERETVAVVFSLKNRAGMRLRNCLRTLRAQTVPDHCIDITICDYGSEPDQLREVALLCQQFGVRLIALRQHDDGWSRTWCLNVGIRHTPDYARTVLFSDVDMLFAPDFIGTLIRCHLVVGGRCFGTIDWLNLPEGTVKDDTDVVRQFWALAKQGTRQGWAGCGGCQSADRAWLFDVRGFDERITMYEEDTDLERRAGMAHMWIPQLQGHTEMLHQWHLKGREVAEMDGRGAAFREMEEQHRQILLSSHTIERNPTGWGELTPQAIVVQPGDSLSLEALLGSVIAQP